MQARPDHEQRRVVERAERPSLDRHLRRIVQILFAGLCLWIGIEFSLFVLALEAGGGQPLPHRPPGVDGFLPISSLISLYHFFISGEIHPAHPAGLFILVAILVVSLCFAKSFCSWLCPFGLLSEWLAALGRRLVGRLFEPPRWLDWPLRGIKYLLLGFFLWAVFFAMSAAALMAFLDSPYNQVADIKMFTFFANISPLALVVIATLMILSTVVRGFWCRYLCPYGALLGLLALLNPLRIRRDPEACVDCGACSRACPSRIPVGDRLRVISDECSTCLACVLSCPVQGALALRPARAGRSISPRWVAVGVVGLFVGITGLGMLSGHWANDISDAAYRVHIEKLESYGHPRSATDIDQLNHAAPGPGAGDDAETLCPAGSPGVLPPVGTIPVDRAPGSG